MLPDGGDVIVGGGEGHWKRQVLLSYLADCGAGGNGVVGLILVAALAVMA